MSEHLLQITPVADRWQVLDSRGGFLGSFPTSGQARAFGDGFLLGTRTASRALRAAIAQLHEAIDYAEP